MPRKPKTETAPEVVAQTGGAAAAPAKAPAKAASTRKTAAKPAAEAKPKAVRKSATHKPVKRAAAELTAAPVAAPVPVFDPADFQAEIAEQAYYFWIERHGAHGHSHEDWLRAEAEIRRRWELAHQGR